jgi:hypothetical protein
MLVVGLETPNPLEVSTAVATNFILPVWPIPAAVPPIFAWAALA